MSCLSVLFHLLLPPKAGTGTVYVLPVCLTKCCRLSVPTGAPQNFTAIGLSPTSIQLQWDLPAQKHRNGEIVMYEVLYHQQKQSTVDFATNTTDKTMKIEGLEPVTDYNFQIRAYTAVGPGPWSNRLPFRPFAQR